MPAVPYARRAYDPRGSRISELLLRQGTIAAEGERERGDISARMWGQFGDIANRSLSELVRQREEAPKRELLGLQVEEAKVGQAAREKLTKQDQALMALFSSETPPTPDAIIRVVGPERGMNIVKGLSALQTDSQKQYANTQALLRDVLLGMDSLSEPIRAEVYPGVRQNLISRGIIQESDAPPTYDPAWFTAARNFGKEPVKPVAVAPGGSLVNPETMEVGFTAPNPVAEAQARDREQDNKRQADAAAETARHNAAMEALQRQSNLTTAERQARVQAETERHNRAMEESARNRTQARPVTAGDAADLSDFDTALDDVSTLRTTVSGNKATGTAAKIGASIPNWATELTGWGADAKSQQAVIDRVKQVIGKTLEGGVLRKEDEIKYAKILPTIGDVASVVATKLDGLEKAIRNRKQRRLDALEDAGFNVTNFNKPQAAPPAAPKADPLGIR